MRRVEHRGKGSLLLRIRLIDVEVVHRLIGRDHGIGICVGDLIVVFVGDALFGRVFAVAGNGCKMSFVTKALREGQLQSYEISRS